MKVATSEFVVFPPGAVPPDQLVDTVQFPEVAPIHVSLAACAMGMAAKIAREMGNRKALLRQLGRLDAVGFIRQDSFSGAGLFQVGFLKIEIGTKMKVVVGLPMPYSGR